MASIKSVIIILLSKLPGCATSLLAGSPGAVDVVLAGLDLVGLAADVRAIETARDKALLVPEFPGGPWEAAVAAEAAGEATGQQVLGANFRLNVLQIQGTPDYLMMWCHSSIST